MRLAICQVCVSRSYQRLSNRFASMRLMRGNGARLTTVLRGANEPASQTALRTRPTSPINVAE